MQLKLIQPTVEEELREQLAKTNEQLNGLRRGVFGRYDKMIMELCALQKDVDSVKEAINYKDKPKMEQIHLDFTLNAS